VSPHQFNLKVNETSNLTVTVSGTGSFSSNVSWSSSNPEIATVDRNGLVTAVSKGKATITATSNQDSSKQDSSIATISNLPPVVSMLSLGLMLGLGAWKIGIAQSLSSWLVLFFSLVLGVLPFAILGLAIGYLVEPKRQ
jgi:hypothetical protein